MVAETIVSETACGSMTVGVLNMVHYYVEMITRQVYTVQDATSELVVRPHAEPCATSKKVSTVTVVLQCVTAQHMSHQTHTMFR